MAATLAGTQDALSKQNLVIEPVLADRPVIGSSFVNTITFNKKFDATQSAQYLRHSYFTMTGWITTDTMDLTSTDSTLAHNNHFSQLPVANLFSNITLHVNDKKVSNINNVPAYMLHQKLLYESAEMQHESGNPLMPFTLSNKPFWIRSTTGAAIGSLSTPDIPVGAVGTPAIPTVQFGVMLPDRIYKGKSINTNLIRMFNNAYYNGTVVTNSSNIQFQLSFPFPFLELDESEQDGTLPPNIRVQVQFQPNPSWTQQFIPGLWGLNAANVNWTEFKWNVPHEIVANPPRNLQWKRKVIDIESYRTLHNANVLQWTIPASTRRVTISFSRRFISSGTGGNTDCEWLVPSRVRPIESTSQTIDGGVIGTDDTISRLYISFNGRNFPINAYNLTQSGSSGMCDFMRAWQDYLRFGKSFELGESNILNSYKKWLNHPVYVFDTTGVAGTDGTAMLYLYTEGAPAMSGTNYAYDVNMTAEYVKELSINFDGDGMVSSTDLAVIG